MHDDLNPKAKVAVGSNRSFGLTFAAVFLVVAVWPWIFHGGRIRLWAIGSATVFAALAFIIPQLLAPLNKLWFRFGQLLHSVISPVVLGAMFYFAFLPIGIILWLSGKDLLRLKRDPESTSYWIYRDPPAPGSMSKQF